MAWPPHIKFFIENYEDIVGVLELNTRVREELPDKVAKLLLASVEDDFHQNPWRGFADFQKWHDGKEIAWYSSAFKKTLDWGPYFGAEPLSAERLIDVEVGSDPPYLYLYFAKGKAQSKKVEPQVQSLRTLVNKVNRANTHKGAYGNDQMFLAREPIGDIVNLSELVNPTNMAANFVKRARAFAEAFAPILPRA
jgi:hypothetical protein